MALRGVLAWAEGPAPPTVSALGKHRLLRGAVSKVHLRAPPVICLSLTLGGIRLAKEGSASEDLGSLMACLFASEKTGALFRLTAVGAVEGTTPIGQRACAPKRAGLGRNLVSLITQEGPSGASEGATVAGGADDGIVASLEVRLAIRLGVCQGAFSVI